MIYSKIFETKTTDMANELNTFNKEHPEYKYRRMDVLVPYDTGITVIMVTYDVEDIVEINLTPNEVKFIYDFLGDKVRSFRGLNSSASRTIGRSFSLDEVRTVANVFKKNGNYYCSKEN